MLENQFTNAFGKLALQPIVGNVVRMLVVFPVRIPALSVFCLSNVTAAFCSAETKFL